MRDSVSKRGETYVYSLSSHCPTTETFVFYRHFKDQNKEGNRRSRLTTIQHPKAAARTRPYLTNGEASCVIYSAPVVWGCDSIYEQHSLSCPRDRGEPGSTQIRAGANLVLWSSSQTWCCVSALLSALSYWILSFSVQTRALMCSCSELLPLFWSERGGKRRDSLANHQLD